jgi:hypothetical protein
MGLSEVGECKPNAPIVVTDWIRNFFKKNPAGSFTVRTIIDATGINPSTVKNVMPFISGLDIKHEKYKPNVYSLTKDATIECFRQGRSGRLLQSQFNSDGSGLRGAYHTVTLKEE